MKVCWTLSNIFAEPQLATLEMSHENVAILCNLSQAVSLHMQGENYQKCTSEVLYALGNLITECDIEKLYKCLIANDPQ